MAGRGDLSAALRLIEQTAGLRGLFTQEQLDRFYKVEKRLSDSASARPFRVVFCGVFSSGKTSLINAMLQYDYRLPEGINPVTKMITRLRGGDKMACAYPCEGREHSVPPDYIDDLIQGKKQLIHETRELIITLPAEMLRGNVEFLDTPGFNDEEIGGALEQMSREAIYEADMAVMCCNSLQLGKIMERDLLGELESLMGHFCLVITRMDNLNTKEDGDAVVAQANRLMTGKGNDAGVFGGGHCFVFPVAIHGLYRHTDEFANYLKAILSDDAMKQQIRDSSDKKCLALCLDEIRPVVARYADTLREEIDRLAARNRAAVGRQEVEAQLRQTQFTTRRREAGYAAAEMANARMALLSANLRSLRDPLLFQNDATHLVNAAVNALMDDIAAYGSRQGLSDYGRIRDALRQDYFRQGFVVPPPFKTRVRVRGFMPRLFGTLWNFMTFRFRIDDGCEEVFGDYYTPAVEAVRSGPMQWVCASWDRFLAGVQSEIRTGGFTGGCEQAMLERQTLLRRCKAIQEK